MKSNTEPPHAIENPHALTGDEVLRKLDSAPEGLSADEAARRRSAVGPNRLPEPPREGLLKRFFKHFHDLLIYILIAAAGITAVLGHWVDTGVILGVVIINAIIGFIQEGKADPAPADAGVGDRHGMAYSGTMVAAGRGTGTVTATGPATELGRINRMISEVETLATPLTRQMNRFGRILSIVVVGLAALMWFAGRLLHDFTTSELFLAAIGFAVAAIPEGLPAILTITLALGVQRMARRKAITRKLNAVETLGSVTVVCSDKTGTLTRNEMIARDVVTRTGRYAVSGTGYQPEGEISREKEPAALEHHPDLRALIEVMAVCNDSEIAEKDGHWSVTGEPTEGALRTLAHKAGFEDKDYERVAVIPFESENKFMATLNRVPGGGARILFKGAPDRLLDRCPLQSRAETELAAEG